MSTCDNCVLKNFQPPFARLGTGTTTNALAELIFLILMLIFYFITCITGSIARSANLPVFSLLRGRF